MSEHLRVLTLRNAAGLVRREMHDGREHLVVPVIALVEGVIRAVNSKDPELVRAAEFQDVTGWEGVPVHAGHPMVGGRPVSGRTADWLPKAMGFVRNARAAADRLHMEAWIDPTRCTDGHSKRILEAVTAEPPRMVEVSVGVYTNAVPTEGVWAPSGKRYAAEWKGMHKDHLALLPIGVRGACNTDMGCGVRAAMELTDHGLEEVVVENPMSMLARFGSMLKALMPSGWGDDEVQAALYDALKKIEPRIMRNGQIVRVTNDAVVYMLWPAPAPYEASNFVEESTQWRRKFTFDVQTQEYTLGEAERVYPETVYNTHPGDARIAAFDPDQPRDERGQWSAGGTWSTSVHSIGRVKAGSELKSGRVVFSVTQTGGKGTDYTLISRPPGKFDLAKDKNKLAYDTYPHDTELFVVPPKSRTLEGASDEEHVDDCDCADCKQKRAEPKAAAAPCPCGGHAGTTTTTRANEGDRDMDKQARIKALAENPHAAIRDPKVLEGLSDDALKSLEASAATASKTAADLKAAQEQGVANGAALQQAQADIKALQEKPSAFKLEDAPQAIRDLVAQDEANKVARKDELVGKLKAAAAGFFTEEQLKAMSLGELENYAKFAKVDAPVAPASYIGRGLPSAPRAAAEGENYAAPDPYAAGLKK